MNILAPDSFEPSMPDPPRRAIRGSDLNDFLLMLRRRIQLVVGAFAIVSVLIIAYTILQPRLYTSTATIMINPRQERILSQDQSISDTPANSAIVDSELEVLRSRELAERLVEAMHLETRAEWNPDLRPRNPLAGFISGLKFWTHHAEDGESSSGVNQDVVDRVARAISVRRRALSFVIDISVTARDPGNAARMANKAVDAYLEMGYEARVETTHRASGWLEQRLRRLRADVQEKEAAAQTYRAQTGLFTSDGVTLTESQISDVQGSVLEARADLAEREARYHQVEQLIAGGGRADTIPDVLNSQVIRDLRQREAELQRQSAEYQSTLGPRHPDVLRNQAELEDVRGQIQAEVQRILASLAGEVKSEAKRS